jgi:catechol 2,3-dioxygenase-like lactoylglutathione lyase family enzyme
MVPNPDHVTIAVADAERAIEFFALLGFRKQNVATIDGGLPARYMGMPGMKAQHITLAGAAPPFEIQLLRFDPPGGADPGSHPTNLRQRAQGPGDRPGSSHSGAARFIALIDEMTSERSRWSGCSP